MKIFIIIIQIQRSAQNASYLIISVYFWKKIIRKGVIVLTFENTFQRDKTVGKTGEKIVSEYYNGLDYDVIDVSEITQFQQQDIDFLIDGESVEVKTQSSLQENKICIELVGNLERNYKGWFFKTMADYIIFVDTVNNILYKIRMADLMKYYFDNKQNIKEIRQENYYKTSIIAFIPLSELQTITERIELN